jgi:hypothetical protein
MSHPPLTDKVTTALISDNGDNGASTINITLTQLTPNGTLLSRAEAKRLCEQLEGFTNVLLDFTGIEWIGQGFADQLFRVYHNARPECQLVPIHANDAVSKMIQKAVLDATPKAPFA